jgi:nitric oxide reductase subunit B
MLSLYWISTCWIASSIFILADSIKKGNSRTDWSLVNIPYLSCCFLLVGGSLTGMVIGPLGLMGKWWYWLGHQGWEFVDFGKGLPGFANGNHFCLMGGSCISEV